MILAATIEWGIGWDGCLRLLHDGHDIARGPLGVLLYLVFVPFYGLIAPARRSAFLVASSLLLALATLGVGYTLMVFGLVLLGLGAVRTCATERLRWLGLGILVAWYVALLANPHPSWLPAVGQKDSTFFYVHWAGLAYLFLKSWHVLWDVASGRMPQPRVGEFLAYLLFAPTLRMGPIYRYREFESQLCGDARANRSLSAAGARLLTGLLRLGIMSAGLAVVPLDILFIEPQSLSPARLIFGIYFAPIAFYLWVSGYVDLSIAVGRTMGFLVPENFNYPWRATNISDFWQRWHITLGAWLQDYVFTPLVRRRVHFFLSFVLTFLFCGLWHAPWPCYIIWGLAQGVGLGVRRWWVRYWKRQRQSKTPLYLRLERLGLARGRAGLVLAWVVTFHYEILTLTVGVDVYHAGRLVYGRLLGLVF